MLSVLVLLLSSCERSANAPASDIRAEPVVVYASYDDPSYLPDFFEAYTATSGVRVIVRNAESIVDEVIGNSGSPPADVLLTPDVAGIWRAAAEGALRPLAPELSYARLPAWLRDSDGYWVAISYRTSAIAYDSRAADIVIPTRYKDLAEQRFRGQLCLSRSSDSVNRTVIAMLIDDLGVRPAEIVVRGWMANLAMPVFDSQSELIKAIESMQCQMGIVSSVNFAMAAENAAVAMRSAAIAESYANIEGVGVARHSKNPDGAAKLIEWMLSVTAQASHSKQMHVYPVTGVNFDSGVDRKNVSTVGWHTEDAAKLAERAGYW